MNKMKYALLLCCIAMLASTGCSDRKFLYSWDDEPKTTQKAAQAATRKPLDVPPDLRALAVLPKPEQVSIGAVPAIPKMVVDNKVVGKHIALDARIYPKMTAAQVFSATIDAMTALNLPVQSVDSPSGTLTTDWVRDHASDPNAGASAMGSLFGAGILGYRYRYIVRVLRQPTQGIRLEIRTLGQAFIAKRWVNKALTRKISNELFTATEEQLGRLQTQSTLE
ncbi:MAG: hypothetical protein R8K21_03705 [Mariprofundales bacterium]